MTTITGQLLGVAGLRCAADLLRASNSTLDHQFFRRRGRILDTITASFRQIRIANGAAPFRLADRRMTRARLARWSRIIRCSFFRLVKFDC